MYDTLHINRIHEKNVYLGRQNLKYVTSLDPTFKKWFAYDMVLTRDRFESSS